MRIPKICRYCGGKIIKSKTHVLYGKGNETIYLCTMCNAYVGCYPGTDKPMGWTRSAAYRWLAKSLQVSEENAHIGMMEMDDCERVIRLCRDYKNNEEAA